MQKEYKDSMNHISLSEADKKRILENVMKTCGNMENNAGAGLSEKPKLRYSFRQIGTVAAACLVFCISAALIYNQFIGKNMGNSYNSNEGSLPPSTAVWKEFDSIRDIAKETDCKTYTPGHIVKEYKVAKVEVEEAQKHVKITYRNKKDDILFEYKEEEYAKDVTDQFQNEKELATEKVGDFDVTMYGEEECDALTWQQESCTFAVRMTKACSPAKARKIVSETRVRYFESDKDKGSKKSGNTNKEAGKVSGAAVIGWKKNEKPSSVSERKKVLKKVYDRLGFRVAIGTPAERITYKMIGDYESFAYYYNDNEEIAGYRVVGYAGWEGAPEGVMDSYSLDTTVNIDGVTIDILKSENHKRLFSFKKNDIHFVLMIDSYFDEVSDSTLSELLSIIHVFMDDGRTDSERTKEESQKETGEKGEKNKKTEEETEQEKEVVNQYKEEIQNIQDAAAEKSLKKLSGYIQYPIQIREIGKIQNAQEFQALSAELVFSSDWVDAVVSFSTQKIKADTKAFTMGDSLNSLVCKIKNNAVVITELHFAKSVVAEPTATPSAE